MTDLITQLKDLGERATPGPWESDIEDNDGNYGSGDDCASGFKSSMIIGPDGLSLFDALNSTAIVVHEELADEDGYVYAWDETSRANAALIVLLRNNLLTIIQALEAQENPHD